MDKTTKTNISDFRMKRLSYSDIMNSVKNIMKEGSTLKKAIFRTSLMNERFDTKYSKDYLNAVNDFLRSWDTYSTDLYNGIKDTEGHAGTYTIEFRYVKEFIYAKYDYASVLPFADGVIKGVSSGKFSDPDDIKDFYNYTISKAFDDNVDSAAGLLDIISPDTDGSMKFISATALDAKSFDSIRGYNMFRKRDRQELYVSITKVIQYLSQCFDSEELRNIKNAKLFITIINSIIDYITYSLTIYASRIYVISVYAYPFIMNNGEAGFAESAINDDKPESTDMKNEEITIFRNIDELITRNPDMVKDLLKTFSEFIQKIGAAEVYDGKLLSIGYYLTRPTDFKNNRFDKALINNPLYAFITGRDSYISRERNLKDIESLNRLVKSLIYNDTQGLQNTSSTKHELLHVIRGTCVENESLEEYKALSKELYIFSVKFCEDLSMLINMISAWKSESVDNNARVSNGTVNSLSEISKILRELYRDVTAAIVHKAKDLEEKINFLRAANTDKIVDNMRLNIHGETNNSNDNMMTAVPDTTRMPIELSDAYELPTYESLQMYDEYARYILGDVDYYSEAVNLAELINKIFAKIRAAVDRFRTFYMDKDVQRAIKWVTEHEQEIMSMDFSAAEMADVLPYKVNVGLPKNFSNLQKGLSSIKEENLKDSGELDKFIKSLYPSQEIYNWFNDPKDTDHKSGHLKYRSLILFKDENEVIDHDPEKISLKGAQIQRNVRDWVTTVKSTKGVYDSLDKIKKDIESGINKVKLVSAGMDQKNQQQTKSQPPAAIGSETNDTTKQNQPAVKTTQLQNTDNNQMGNAVNLSEKAILEIQLATARLFEPLSMMFIEYIRMMYKYMQEAYSKGRKK